MKFRTSKDSSEIGMKPRLARTLSDYHPFDTNDAIRGDRSERARSPPSSAHCLLSRCGALSRGVNMASNLAKRAS
jgi:hypothetical protein